MEDLDEVTAFLGDYGPFQITIHVLLSACVIPHGCMGMIMIFLADTPQHHCKPPIHSEWNTSDFGADFNGNWSQIGPDKCSRYRQTHNSSMERFGNGAEGCLDGWVYSTEIYISNIVSEWDLVCDSAWMVPFTHSIYFFGVLVGSLISGQLSDRFGRKPVFFLSMAVQIVFSLIQSASVNLTMFCVFNFLRGLAEISSYMASYILGAEILNKRTRICYSLVGQGLCYSIGHACLPLMAYFIRDWRMLLVAVTIPVFLYFPLWWVIPESPRWLVTMGRFEEAETILRNAAKRNKIAAPEVLFGADDFHKLVQSKDEEQKQNYTFLDLFRTANMRNMTIANIILWVSSAMIFYGLSINVGNMSVNVYISCFIFAVTDIVATSAIWLLIDRMPRPIILFCTELFCGIVLLLIIVIPPEMHVIIQVLAMLGKLCVSAAYSLLYLFSIELIPTVVRNRGFGVLSMAARIGSTVCPYVVYLGLYSKLLPYIIFGIISILAAAVSMTMPDTRHSKFPDNISQVQPIRCFCSRKKLLQPDDE